MIGNFSVRIFRVNTVVKSFSTHKIKCAIIFAEIGRTHGAPYLSYGYLPLGGGGGGGGGGWGTSLGEWEHNNKFLPKNEKSFCGAKALHIFRQKRCSVIGYLLFHDLTS